MALITSIYMCGLFLGSLICSTSDRFGRKAVLVVSWAIAAVAGSANAFVKSYVAFCVLRFFTGAGEKIELHEGTIQLISKNHVSGAMGLFMIGFSMTVEMVGPKWKTLAGNAVQIPFAIGEAIVSLIAAACTGKCLVV